jgi:hypothetical protein
MIINHRKPLFLALVKNQIPCHYYSFVFILNGVFSYEFNLSDEVSVMSKRFNVCNHRKDDADRFNCKFSSRKHTHCALLIFSLTEDRRLDSIAKIFLLKLKK